MKNLTLTALVILALITSCKKRKEDNPCDGKKPFKTDFRMFLKDKWSKSSTGDTLIEIKDGDTCIADIIRFKAIDNQLYTDTYDSLNWIFGNSLNTSNQKETQLGFSTPEFDIPITLTGFGKKLDNFNCFPNTPYKQTIVKKISIVGKQSAAIKGTFYGYNTDEPNDTFSILINFEPRYNFLVVKNFPKGNRGFPYGVIGNGVDSFIGINPGYYGYDYIIFDNAPGNGLTSSVTHGPIYGFAKITNRNQIEINYQQFLQEQNGYWINPKQRKFIGYRK